MSQITPVNSNLNKSKKPQSPSETDKADNKSNDEAPSPTTSTDTTNTIEEDILDEEATNVGIQEATESIHNRLTWDYFVLNEEEGKYTCQACKNEKPNKYSKNTAKSNLDAHLLNVHDIRIHTKSRNTTHMTREDSEKVDRALVYFIIVCCLPFVIIESQYFKEFIACLNPNYKLPCRKKLRILIHDLYTEKFNELKALLLKVSALSLTTDGWTSVQNYSYITATAHFIDENFNFNNISLGFNYINGRHQAENLKDALLKIINDFDLKNKIVAIVADNARNVQNSLASLQKLNIEAIRCMAHVLQLVVKNVIVLVEAGESHDYSLFYIIAKIFTKCRKLVTSFSHSSQLTDLLEEYQMSNGVEKKNVNRLVQDVKTRWHSTFLMAERMLKLHKYIKLIVNDKSQHKNLKVNLLDDNELVILAETVKTLQCFNQLSVLMSGSSYVTCSLIVPSMYYLKKHLTKTRNHSDLTTGLQEALLTSLEHYDEAYEINKNSYLLTATFLDPNYKDFDFCTSDEKKEHMNK